MMTVPVSRRRFLMLAGLGAGALVLGACGRSSGSGAGAGTSRTAPAPSGTSEYALEASPAQVRIGGRRVKTWTYGGSLPGPEIRVKEGERLRVKVKNALPEGTTVHWHGLPIPNGMDGVPYVTQKPIKPGGEFVYEFTVPVSGTYFYHSHVGLQLDRALYGPLVIEPKKESLSYDREYTLMLDDWLDGVRGTTPEDAMKRLKSGGSAMSGMGGMGGMGGGMHGMSGMGGGSEPRQWKPDIVYPYYLINGKPPDSPEELMVKRGERLRLRFINPAGATIFRVTLAGHRMTVTHADGQPVEPVDVDALRIGPGERYDVIVEANNPGVWQLAAQAEGTEKMGRAILRYRGSPGSTPPAGQKPPGLGKKLLTYGMLRAASGVDLPSGSPDQVTPFTLSGNERRYVWMMNGRAFSQQEALSDPIVVGKDKHVRFVFENHSMMPHPMHLHGHSFQVDNGTGRGPLKDTAIVDPMQRLAVDLYADNPGDWAFHCHHLYHMEAGMMRVVRV